jgi:phosphoglucomutase
MSVHPLAGKPAPANILIDPEKLVAAYYGLHPDPTNPEQQVSFGTSGHRGAAEDRSFNEDHILATTQAICEYRAAQGFTGPLYLGRDTHAASEPAERTALEVLAANGVETILQAGGAYTATPGISHAILVYNRGRSQGLSDGIVVTPSHNPPRDGGFKYNPPHGGPADTDATTWIQDRANALLREQNASVKRVSYETAKRAGTTHERDFAAAYIAELEKVIDIAAIRNAGLRLGADPLGGASVAYWSRIAEHYGLEISVVNPTVDPRFAFMTVDHDGKIRMDCSSPYAMAKLVGLKNDYDVAFGNDPDSDRHGIVAPSAGLLNPNHYLAVAIRYLFSHRPKWPVHAAVGKTLVSSSLIDRVVAALGRPLKEVPVGFKWFVSGLVDGSLGFGSVWTTDKDGMILNLLSAEITAVTGKDPGTHYEELRAQFGTPYYTRVDQPATPAQKASLKKLSPDSVQARELAGEPILQKLTRAPANNAEIGGLKVVAENGWFAARPSGTENVYKIYAESFKGGAHLDSILEEARQIVAAALSV